MRPSPRRPRLLALLTLPVSLLALALTGCGEAGSGGGSGGGAAGDAAANENLPVLRVGTEATYPPFESIDEKGDFQGFDIDLVRAIGEQAGYRVDIRNVGFDALIPALQSGQIDLAASAMSITDERKNAVAFSDPYLEAGLVLTVPDKSADITGVDSLAGKVVAVQIGSTGATLAEELKSQGKIADLKYFDTIPLAMMEVQKGGAVAMINDKPTSEAYARQVPGFKVLPTVLKSDPYGLAIKRGNDELVAKVNDALTKLAASGKLDELKAKWLAPTPEVPGAAPADDEPTPAAGTQPAGTQPGE